MTKRHRAPEGLFRSFTLSHALIWTFVLALSAYIMIADIRVGKLWQDLTTSPEEEETMMHDSQHLCYLAHKNRGPPRR